MRACAQEQKAGQRQGGALTIKHTAARKGKGPTGGLKGPPGSDLEKKVLNCLSCGKVYDFRQAAAGQLSNDLLRFLGRRRSVAFGIIALATVAAATLQSLCGFSCMQHGLMILMVLSTLQHQFPNPLRTSWYM